MTKQELLSIVIVIVILAGLSLETIIALYLIHCGYDLDWLFHKLDKLFRRKDAD